MSTPESSKIGLSRLRVPDVHLAISHIVTAPRYPTEERQTQQVRLVRPPIRRAGVGANQHMRPCGEAVVVARIQQTPPLVEVLVHLLDRPPRTVEFVETDSSLAVVVPPRVPPGVHHVAGRPACQHPVRLAGPSRPPQDRNRNVSPDGRRRRDQQVQCLYPSMITNIVPG